MFASFNSVTHWLFFPKIYILKKKYDQIFFFQVSYALNTEGKFIIYVYLLPVS
jgi:hypothetical protein